ncbi:MAG: putative ATPase [Chthonomonadaceae bacterium]|nr:putative ATPase [Chthonomonadaceae bacterium]
MEPIWHICLLGRLTASRHDRVIQRFKAGKAASLFAYLAYFAGQEHAREQLMDLFWPDSEVEAAQHSLRQALSSLRRQVEPPDVPPGTVLHATRQLVQLRAESVTTDVAAMRRYIRQAEMAAERGERIHCYEQAVAFYTGDLLPSLYEEWALIERERLTNEYVRVLDALVGAFESREQKERALDYALRAAAALPFEEPAYTKVIRLYAELGRPADALRHYRKLETRLQSELGSEPGPELQALLRELGIAKQQSSRRLAPRAALSGAVPKLPSGGETPVGDASAAEIAPPAAISLPIKRTRFIGREAELDRLVASLAYRAASPQERPIPRLVTLTGIGGAGKTRLALEAAHRLAPDYAPALTYVSLADVTSGSDISAALLDRLQGPKSASAAPIKQILDALSRQPTLLVLDNFEHLLPEGAGFLHMLLQQVPTLTCLVTSRQLLGLDGEQEIPVEPLPIPSGSTQPSHLITFASVQLFLDRAQAVLPDFQITTRNARFVSALCVRLEGLPLAIELAASRIRTLTPAQMLTQLADRFGFLVSRRSDSETRQLTLRTALDWSYEPLPPDLKRLLGQLSVFRGGWTLSAVESVCAAPDAVLLLEHLRERSLISAQEVDGEMRYRMLEMVREYAAEQVEAEEQKRLFTDHAAYFVAFAEHVESRLRGSEQTVWIDRVEQELDNIRAVANNPSVSGETLIRIGGALWRFWAERGYLHEGRAWLHRAIEASPGGSPLRRAKALHAAGVLARAQGDYFHARACLEESLRLYEQEADMRGMAEVLNYYSVLENEQGNYQAARACLERSLPLWEAMDDLNGLASNHNGLGQTTLNQEDFDAAEAHFKASIAIYRQLGDLARQAILLNNLASVAIRTGEHARAQMLLQDALTLFRSQRNRLAIAITLHNLGETSFRMGEMENARRFLMESIGLRHALGNSAAGLVRSFASLSWVERSSSAYDRATQLLAAAEALRSRTATAVSAQDRALYDQERSLLETLLTPATFEAYWAAGLAMSIDQAVDFALSTETPTPDSPSLSLF